MATNKIPGDMLSDNLARTSNLAVDTDTLYIDVTNDRVGVNTNTPTKSLEVDNVTIEGSEIRSKSGALDLGATSDITISGGTNNYVLITDGNGVLNWSSPSSIGINGSVVELGTPTDTSLYPVGAINNWQTTTLVTDAIDDLNELSANMINDTAVANIDFTADITSGGEGSTVTLTITADGNPTRYDINWGTGESATTGTTDSTPSHTYNDNSNSPFTVTVTAYNHNGSGTGSSVSKTRIDYILIATADPVVGFDVYDAISGGSTITFSDSGETVYLENTTTNSASATVDFDIDWGDSSSDNNITNADAGGVGGGRLAHTYTNASETDSSYTIDVELQAHNTCEQSILPLNSTQTHLVYSTHTPSFTTTTLRGVNEESTSGHPVTFTNTTETSVGSYATFGNQYVWDFDYTTQTINVGSGSAGDTSQNISRTFSLSSAQQSAGTTVTFPIDLTLNTSHASSPFTASSVNVIVEPDVRANITGTAITVSDKTGDDQYDIYDGTDLDGVNRALVRLTNTSQNADDYVYDWDDTGSDDTVTEDGASAGSIGATINHDYSGESIGNHTVTFTSNGTPDTIAQTDSETLTFQLNSVPSAPQGLSSYNITLADSHQGTSPLLCATATDNSDTSPLSAGASLTTTTARRYTSGTIDTSTVNNSYNGASGTLSAVVNGVAQGSKTFSTTENETGTYTSLVITQQGDAHDTVSSSTYPSNFYQTFDANITQALTSYSVGINDQRLEHNATGNTNYVAVVYDDITSTPSLSTGTLSEGTSGTKRYISGIPYYNTGSPTVTLSGIEVTNFTGQAYQNTTSPFTVASGTNAESTSSSAISTQNYTYADIDGGTTFLNSGIPVANTGVGTAYMLGDIDVDITSSSVRTVEQIKFRAKNANGTGSYTDNSTKLQVHTASQSGISEIAIAVSDSLGATYDDDGVRVFDFSADTTDTPSFNGATNFYTNDVYTESSDPGVSGTKEATIRLGVLEHNTTDYSTGYLPVGPDRSADTGTQYFTFAFRRTTMANFDINIVSSSGISGLFIASPGTDIDDASGLNGWLDTSLQYAGAGIPGSDTGNSGNGSNGCAFTGADVISTGSSLNGSFTQTLGSENASNATGNVVLVRIALASGESVTSLSIS